MIENARLKASASSLLPAYPSKQHGPPSMENTSKSGHTHGDTLTRYTSYTYTGTISTVSIGSSTLPYSNFNNIVFQKKFNNIELRPLARGFLQSFVSCSSWSLLQAAAAACSSAEPGTQQQSGPLLLLLQRQSTVVCGYLLDSFKNPKQSKQRL